MELTDAMQLCIGLVAGALMAIAAYYYFPHGTSPRLIAPHKEDAIDQGNPSADISEQWNRRFISMSENNNLLTFIDRNKTPGQRVVLSLNQLSSVKLTEKRSLLEKRVKEVWIELETIAQHKYKLTFYNEIYDRLIELPFLSQSAQHWQKRLNKALQKDNSSG